MKKETNLEEEKNVKREEFEPTFLISTYINHFQPISINLDYLNQILRPRVTYQCQKFMSEDVIQRPLGIFQMN